jgi:4-hydroxy-tetrahydrodipicolinate reductase
VIGASGTLGADIIKAIAANPDLHLDAAISRRFAGRKVRELVADVESDLAFSPSLVEVLERKPAPDVVVDVSDPDAAIGHAAQAIAGGCHVVIGATLSDLDRYRALDYSARDQGVGVLVAPNLSVSSAMMRLLAIHAAALFAQATIVDRAAPHVRAPLRTSLDLARCLERGGLAARIESVRAPGLLSEISLWLQGDGQELVVSATVKSTQPYVDGMLVAVRRVGSWSGVRIGLDTALSHAAPMDWASPSCA